MKLLIDTNIILDVLMNRLPWAKAAQDVILAVAEEKAEGSVTANCLTDIHFLLRKHLKDEIKTRQALLGLLTILSVLDVTGSDCEKAFDLPMSDYEDALLVTCGKRHKVDCIITRDLKHYEGSSIKAFKPEEILKDL